MNRFLPALFLAGAAALSASPALAQGGGKTAIDTGPVDSGSERVNAVIVYGDDPCPQSNGDEITVCARKDESERYRIPEPFRGPDPNKVANQAWAERAKAFETVGQFGTNSCSPVGGGGATGCMQQLINKAYAEKKQASDVRFGKIIEAEREKRLSTIDADAAAEQARVEAIEKEYEAKKAAEEDAKEKAAAGAKGEAAKSAAPLSTPPGN
ncbi:MAG: hypothetical protein KGL48_11750 [Sphingomonadales bacterium]|nr:hypothetical protein [Sphingomonadales bacterium]MDE2568329.1 hypothetical protein [Sphingomonadales bacterium]